MQLADEEKRQAFNALRIAVDDIKAQKPKDGPPSKNKSALEQELRDLNEDRDRWSYLGDGTPVAGGTVFLAHHPLQDGDIDMDDSVRASEFADPGGVSVSQKSSDGNISQQLPKAADRVSYMLANPPPFAACNPAPDLTNVQLHDLNKRLTLRNNELTTRIGGLRSQACGLNSMIHELAIDKIRLDDEIRRLKENEQSQVELIREKAKLEERISELEKKYVNVAKTDLPTPRGRTSGYGPASTTSRFPPATDHEQEMRTFTPRSRIDEAASDTTSTCYSSPDDHESLDIELVPRSRVRNRAATSSIPKPKSDPEGRATATPFDSTAEYKRWCLSLIHI